MIIATLSWYDCAFLASVLAQYEVIPSTRARDSMKMVVASLVSGKAEADMTAIAASKAEVLSRIVFSKANECEAIGNFLPRNLGFPTVCVALSCGKAANGRTRRQPFPGSFRYRAFPFRVDDCVPAASVTDTVADLMPT